MRNNIKPSDFDEKLKHSIDLLKKAERLALNYSNKGFCLAFSGGKDSQALYHVSKLAEVRFEAHYHITTLDPPELVHFIKDNYPDVILDRPALTFSDLCIKKKILPTRLMRFCCAALKESHGGGSVTLTGIRKKESVKRSRRNEMEISGRKFSGTQQQFDQFTREKEVEGVQCIKGKDRIIINPIIEWAENDVWYFLNNIVKVKHCKLYDEGWSRIGCLFCPMSSKANISRDCQKYPKYKAMLIRTIHRIRESGGLYKFPDLTDEEYFNWWISKETLKKWYFGNKQQQNLFNKK